MNDLSFLDDAALIDRIRDGANEALSVLWTRYYASAFNYAQMRSGRFTNDSDDIVTDAYAKVWQAISRGRGPTQNFRAYLYATIRTVVADRQYGIEEPVDDVEAHMPHVPDHGDMYQPSIEQDIVARCFYELGQRHREVLWLSAVEGLKPAEIATRLGVGARYVSVVAMRARGSFRKLYDKAVEEMASELEPTAAEVESKPRRALGVKLLGGVAGLTAAQAAASGMAWASASAIVSPPAMPGVILAAGAGAAGAGTAAGSAGGVSGGASGTGAAAGVTSSVMAWVIGTAVAFAVAVGALGFGYLSRQPGPDNPAPPPAASSSANPASPASEIPSANTPSTTPSASPSQPSSPVQTPAGAPTGTPSATPTGNQPTIDEPTSDEPTSDEPTSDEPTSADPTVEPSAEPEPEPSEGPTVDPVHEIWPATLPQGWPDGWGTNYPPGQTSWPQHWSTDLPTVWPTEWPDHWPDDMRIPWPTTMPTSWPAGYPTNWPTAQPVTIDPELTSGV